MTMFVVVSESVELAACVLQEHPQHAADTIRPDGAQNRIIQKSGRCEVLVTQGTWPLWLQCDRLRAADGQTR